jgi:hypothetical protein
MKITTSEYFRGHTESSFIDLYKINNISEASQEERFTPFYVHVKEDPYAFFTTFTAPGSHHGYTVNGTAKELITHIEDQQKRARKGLEIESYEPKRKLYTESGNVHALNQSFKPNENGGWKPSNVDT